jgi:hypothetical protein
MRAFAGLLSVLLAATALSLAAPKEVHAQGVADAALATELFGAGRKLVERGDFATACPKFAESARLDEKVGTLLNLADCEEHISELTNARIHWQKAQSVAERTKDARAAVAKERFGRLEAMIPRITITLGADSISGLSVRLDDTEIRTTSFDEALPVDPGRHVVRVTAPGKAEWSTVVEAHVESPAVLVVVPALQGVEQQSVPLLASANASASQWDRDAARAYSPFWTTPRVIGVAAAGIGVAAAAVGTVFAMNAQSSLDESNRAGHCIGNACDGPGRAARNDALDSAGLATGAFVASGAGLVAGAVLFFVVPSARRPAVTVGALAAPRAGGIDLYGVF